MVSSRKVVLGLVALVAVAFVAAPQAEAQFGVSPFGTMFGAGSSSWLWIFLLLSQNNNVCGGCGILSFSCNQLTITSAQLADNTNWHVNIGAAGTGQRPQISMTNFPTACGFSWSLKMVNEATGSTHLGIFDIAPTFTAFIENYAAHGACCASQDQGHLITNTAGAAGYTAIPSRPASPQRVTVQACVITTRNLKTAAPTFTVAEFDTAVAANDGVCYTLGGNYNQ